MVLSSIKKRRTRAELDALQAVICAVVAHDQPMTNRHTFYRVVSEGAIEKTEQGYRTVCRELVRLRRSGVLPFDWIADNTRWIRRARTYRSLQDVLTESARLYRRTLWESSPVHVEVWCESDSIASVLVEETYLFDVPLMVFRGYSSEGYLYTLGEEIKAHGRPTCIYYFGDYDPSGIDIARAALKRVREFAPDATITFERIAVTPEQIATQHLLTRPPKQSDPRTKGFQGATVEIEALPSPQLRGLVRQCILAHVDEAQWQVLATAEENERQILTWLAAAVPHYMATHSWAAPPPAFGEEGPP